MAKGWKLTPVQTKLGDTKEEMYGGLEKSLWGAADKLRSNMDAAEYKHAICRP